MLKKIGYQAWKLYRANPKFSFLIFVEITILLFVSGYFVSLYRESRQAEKIYECFNQSDVYIALDIAQESQVYGTICELLIEDESMAASYEGQGKLFAYTGEAANKMEQTLGCTEKHFSEDTVWVYVPYDGYGGLFVGETKELTLSVYVPDGEEVSLYSVCIPVTVLGTYKGNMVMGTAITGETAAFAVNFWDYLGDGEESRTIQKTVCTLIKSPKELQGQESLAKILENRMSYQKEELLLYGTLLALVLILCISGWLGFELVFYVKQEKTNAVWALCGAKRWQMCAVYGLFHTFVLIPPLVAGYVLLWAGVAVFGIIRFSFSGCVLPGICVFICLQIATQVMVWTEQEKSIVQKVRRWL